MPKDVFDAMAELEFDSFLPRLEAEVAKFTSIQADKRNSYRRKVKEEKKAKENGDTPAKAVNGHPEDDEERATKRARRSSVDSGKHNTGSEEEDGVEETAVDDNDDDEEVEDDEIEDEPTVEEGLTEDLLEEKVAEASDDDMADRDESD